MPKLEHYTGDFDWRYYTEAELGSITLPSGASLIGVEDAGGYFVNSDVEAILQEVVITILPANYLRLDGTNIPIAPYVWTTNLTTTGIITAGSFITGTVTIATDANGVNFTIGGARIMRLRNNGTLDLAGDINTGEAL